MRKLVWLCLFSLWPLSAAMAANTSTYTKFDLDTCRKIDPGDEYVYAGTWACKGIKGYDIIVSSADDRDFVGFGKANADQCSRPKTCHRFNTALSPVEWRMKNGKPIAAIERWRVVTDDEGGSVTWLVVNALRPGESCHVHYISGSYPDANAAARRIADELAEDFDCENEAPTVDSTVGAPPIDITSCSEVARE